MRRHPLAAGLVACALFTAAPASAEPLRVTSGGLTLDYEADFFRLNGSGFSFSLEGGIPENYLLRFPASWNTSCFIRGVDETCALGELFDPSFRTLEDAYLGVGQATIGGLTHTNVTFRGFFEIDSDSTLMTVPVEPVTGVFLPFMFTGELRGYRDGQELFTASLFGGGSSRTPFFYKDGIFEGEEGRVDYRFEDLAPTPEPGTWLLLATGAAALAARRRRRQP